MSAKCFRTHGIRNLLFCLALIWEEQISLRSFISVYNRTYCRNTTFKMRILKTALVVIEHLLIIASTKGVTISSSYNKSDVFHGDLLDEFQTVSLVKCLKTCDEDRPECQAGRYNADSRLCQHLAEMTGGSTVTWLSDSDWTVFQKVRHVQQYDLGLNSNPNT